jgi:hypothetical protein
VVSDAIVNVLVVPLSALAATVIYVELRRVKGQPLAEDADGPPQMLPPQQPAPEGTQTSGAPPESQDAPPQPSGPEAPPR